MALVFRASLEDVNKYSTSSAQRLLTCDHRLQLVFNEVLQIVDHSILCGHRGQVEQDKDFALGLSKLKWPNGKHNSTPSKAVDAKPVGIADKDEAAYLAFARIVLEVAARHGIKMRWGGDWNQNWRTDDEKFRDLQHFELVE